MITFACVWRDHGYYTAEWITKLAAGVKRHYPHPHRFVCLTDYAEPIEGAETIKLEHNWPKYWSKIELFRPNLFDGPVMYFDLDVLITGSLEPLVQDWPNMVMITDHLPEIDNSSMMYWDARDSFYEGIYLNFAGTPERFMRIHAAKEHVADFGDQEYIGHYLKRGGRPAMRWQDILPSEWFIEFCAMGRLNPIVERNIQSTDLKVAFCLGIPKFHDVPHVHLVKNHWYTD